VVEDYSLNANSLTNHSADDLPKETPVELNKLAIPSTGKDIKAPESPGASVSEASQYQTAVNTPVVESEEPKAAEEHKDTTEGPGDAVEDDPTAIDREQAQKLFDSQDQVVGNETAAAWLGDPDRAKVREAYMRFFNWSNVNILAALRSLCERLVLKGETQQVDRVLDAFSNRWCDCNPSHGFKATGKFIPCNILVCANLTHPFRCCAHDLLLPSSLEYRSSLGRYRPEDDQIPICTEHYADHSSSCYGRGSGGIRHLASR
jgi:hypothetical protein